MPAQNTKTESPHVNFIREEVTSLMPRWDTIRDCVSGEKAIKDKGDKYLPRPNSADTSTENQARYNSYKTRAVFYGVTGRTLRGLVGQVFAKDPELVLPSTTMESISLDADGGGVSLNQQAKKSLSHVIAHGRCGILTDYPKTAITASIADIQSGKVKPNITLYDPWDIINWRTQLIGTQLKLTLVVISESRVVDDDGFEAELDYFYRVLRLIDGVYHSQIWSEKDAIFTREDDTIPLDGNGRPWDEIPFTFIGAENNDAAPDLPPLYDMAVLNIAHYRNSADYEEACYIVGQPTPYFAGLTESWVEQVLKGKVELGSRAAVPLPVGGTAGLLQATENTMPAEAMEHKERQMVALGAKLVQQTQVQRTATESTMEEASTTSLLATAAKNVSSAYTKSLKWSARFLNIEVAEDDGNCSYELNTEFDIARLGAQGIQAVIAAWQAQAISRTEMRGNLKAGGIAYQEDEDANAEIETDPFLLTSLGVGADSETDVE